MILPLFLLVGRLIVSKGLMVDQRIHLKLLLPSVWREGGIEGQLQPLGQLNTREKDETITTTLSNYTSRLQKNPGEIQRNQIHPPTWSSRMISVPRVLSVFHFSVKVSPCSAHLYFVSRDPDTLLVSVLAEPVLVNSCG